MMRRMMEEIKKIEDALIPYKTLECL